MKISSNLYPIYSSNKFYTRNTDAVSKSLSMKNDSVSFKATGTSTATVVYLSYKLAREMYKSGKKYKKIYNNVKIADTILKELPNNKQELNRVIALLASLKTSYEEKTGYQFYTLFNPCVESIEKMKNTVLEKHLLEVDDSNPEGKFVVKNFMEALFDDGDFCTKKYIEIFSKLPDEKYSDLKKNIVSNFLYSKMNTNVKTKEAVYGEFLIESLDKQYYKNYIDENKNAIQKVPSKIINYIKRDFRNNKNLAFQYYIKSYKLDHTIYDEPFLKDFLAAAFYSITMEKCKDSSDLAKGLNVDKKYADYIIEDLDVEKKVEQAKTKEEKMQLYKERIVEKTKFNLPDFELLSSVETYIEQNKYKEDLLKTFKELLNNLYENAWYGGGTSDYDDHPTML